METSLARRRSKQWQLHSMYVFPVSKPIHSFFSYPVHLLMDLLPNSDLCLQLGINYFDTSPFYGATKSESMLGEALKGVDRSRFIVSTKVGRYGDSKFDFSATRVRSSIKESLNRLGLEHLELVICHDIEFGDVNQIATETIPTLRELQREGVVKHIGVSGLPIDLFRQVFEKTKDIDFILSYCHYTMFDTTLKSFWDEKLQGLGVGVINASPLSMGLLTKSGPPEWHPAPDNVKSVCAEVATYCQQHEVDISALGVNYALQAKFPTSTLAGMVGSDMVRRNVAALTQEFPEEVVSWVDDKFKSIKDVTWTSGLPQYNTRLPNQ